MVAAAANAPFRVGLTGGIASGKSAVANMFAELDVAIIDTDVIAREVVAPGTTAIEEIRSAFGPGVITPDGQLDRTAMRRIVFANDEQRRTLEAILHPRIRAETERQAQAAAGAYQVIVVPLLVESPMRDDMQRILVVDVPVEVQLDRLVSRDGESREQAQRMIEAQASREDRLAIADDVVDNSGSLEATRRQVAALHEHYVKQATG